MPRRKNNEGNIYFDEARKKWRGVIKTHGKRKYFSGSTSKEVQDLMFDFRNAKKSGLDVTKTSTLSELSAKFFNVKSRAVTEKTLDEYKSKYNNYIDGYIGHVKVNELTTDRVNILIDDLLDDGLSNNVINQSIKVLTAIMKHAQKLGYIAINPSANAEKLKHEKKVMRSLTPDEIKSFLSHAKDTKLFALFYLLINSGIRLGEALAITWEDINWETDELTINKSYDDKYGLGKTKTKHSERVIKLNGSTMQVLHQHHSAQLEKQTELPKYWNNNGIVFATDIGTHFNRSNIFNRHFTKICKSAGITDIRLHDLRHTFASISLLNGVPVLEISHYLGHKDAVITLETYSHYVPTPDSNTASAIESVIKG